MKELYEQLGISSQVYDFGAEIEESLKERFEQFDKTAEYNQMKVLLGAALQKERDRLLEEENGVLTEETIDYQKTQTGIKGTLSMKMMVEMGEAGALEPPPDTQEDES